MKPVCDTRGRIVTAPLRYIDAEDGTVLAYRVHGEGPPLVLANGVTTSEFFWRYLLPRWSQRFRVLTWDYKGHGHSGPARDLRRTTIPDLVGDLGRVLDAAEVDHAPIVGFSMGSQIAIEAVRGLPGRVDAVVSLFGSAGRLLDTALPPFGPVLEKLLRSLLGGSGTIAMAGFGLALRAPGAPRLGQLLGYLGPHCDRSDIAALVRNFNRLHHATVREIILHGAVHDARDLLATFPVPLLIVAGDNDPFAPARTVGVPMHRSCPGSRLYRMPYGTHTSLFEHPDELARVIEAFLAEAASP